MNVTDLIILYLACGSPFGVYQITKRTRGGLGVDWLRVIFSFLVWPAYAIALATRRIFNSRERADTERRNRIEDIRVDLERLAFKGESIQMLFEFRDIFYRSTGLAQAVNVASVKSAYEIFEICGHPNKSLASRCLARRNREQLIFHTRKAESEFVELISRVSAFGDEDGEIAACALELAGELDSITVRDQILELPLQGSRPTPSREVVRRSV